MSSLIGSSSARRYNPCWMDHDRLFKQLLTTFFFEFIALFLPEVDKYLSRETIEFLDKEIFTDVTGGERREVDVIAKVKFRDTDTFFLFHAEPQSESRGDFPRRMFHYVARLDEKFGLPVYPVAIFTFDAPRRPEKADTKSCFRTGRFWISTSALSSSTG